MLLVQSHLKMQLPTSTFVLLCCLGLKHSHSVKLISRLVLYHNLCILMQISFWNILFVLSFRELDSYSLLNIYGFHTVCRLPHGVSVAKIGWLALKASNTLLYGRVRL